MSVVQVLLAVATLVAGLVLLGLTIRECVDRHDRQKGWQADAAWTVAAALCAVFQLSIGGPMWLAALFAAIAGFAAWCWRTGWPHGRQPSP